MKRIFLHWPGHYASTYYRVESPANYCRQELAMRGVELVADSMIPFGIAFDALFLFRDYANETVEYAAEACARGVPIAWGTDDDLWHLAEDDPYLEQYEERREGFDALRDMARLLVVSTPTLAESIGCQDKTIVCPNLVEPFDPRIAPRPEGQIRVVWAGGGPKERDLDIIVPAINRLAREFGNRVAFYSWACCPPRLAPFVKELKGVDNCDYWPMLAELEPDIFLAPLRDIPFNRCKSNIKWLEGAYAGAALVASDLPPYQMIRDGVDGLLVPAGGDWYPPLKRLIEDRRLRQTLATTARQRVLAEWSWASPARCSWLNAFMAMIA